MPVLRCFQSDHLRTFSGPSASQIGDKILGISVRVSIADLIMHLQSFLQAESCTTLVRVMFEFDAFSGPPF